MEVEGSLRSGPGGAPEDSMSVVANRVPSKYLATNSNEPQEGAKATRGTDVSGCSRNSTQGKRNLSTPYHSSSFAFVFLNSMSDYRLKAFAHSWLKSHKHPSCKVFSLVYIAEALPSFVDNGQDCSLTVHPRS